MPPSPCSLHEHQLHVHVLLTRTAHMRAGAVALSEAIQGGPTAQQHVDPDLLRQLEILEAPPAVPELPPGQPGCSDVGTHAVQPSDGIAPQQQQQQQQQWMVNGGFALDADSGMYYSSSLGLWYNGSTGLYMDAQTGSWCVCAVAQSSLHILVLPSFLGYRMSAPSWKVGCDLRLGAVVGLLWVRD